MIYAKNKYARYAYEILERSEAGIVLTGNEVKAIRNNQANLKGAYISIEKDEAYLKEAYIAPYRFAAKQTQHSPTRPRKLLLHRKEIHRLRTKIGEKGLTIIPLSIYTKGRHIKLELALVRGKKLHDKRASIKKRELDRTARRALKQDY